ncbi:hypothetical protein [Bacteroides fragilis]|jgi:hypothetical protein|uniref:hypothetical protein n=1 Tax=Bacteroides fragilis TaxID=817 RepID=UPI003219CA15
MENRRKLAIASRCRCFLHYHGFITDSEDQKNRQRLMKWQDKNKVSLSLTQADSVEFTYDDNAQEESNDEG